MSLYIHFVQFQITALHIKTNTESKQQRGQAAAFRSLQKAPTFKIKVFLYKQIKQGLAYRNITEIFSKMKKKRKKTIIKKYNVNFDKLHTEQKKFLLRTPTLNSAEFHT